MCFGSKPSAPQVVYQGPSQQEIDANNAALAAYKEQVAQQQKQLADQLQAQIEKTNQQMAQQKAQIANEKAAAEKAQQQGAYAVTTATAEPVNAQVTTDAKPKPNPKSGLKISTGAVATSSGTGINIGV